MVARVEGAAVCVAPRDAARLLEPLLDGVMAGLAQALPVRPIPEKRLRFLDALNVAAVLGLLEARGRDVIHQRGSSYIATALMLSTQRMGTQEGIPRTLPGGGVAALVRSSSAAVVCTAVGSSRDGHGIGLSKLQPEWLQW